MQTLVLTQSSEGTPLTPQQAAFNRHLKKIEKLRNQLDSLKKECERALLLYHSGLRPQQQKAADLISQFLLKITDLARPPYSLKKREREIFLEIVEVGLETLFSLASYSEIDDRLKELYAEINGKSAADEFIDEISSIKEMLKEEAGIDDIDMSNLSPDDDPEEMMMKFMESVRVAMEGREIPSPPPSKKRSKKESVKEQRSRELEELKSKGIGGIYKRLVKEFHPDLEQDPERRAEKELLMKRVTVAYESRDLISLLTIGSQLSLDEADDKTFDVYNALLKDQIKQLEGEIGMCCLDPRYAEIHQYIADFPRQPLGGMRCAIAEVNGEIAEYRLRLNSLSGVNPLKALKKALASLARQFAEDDFSDIMDFITVTRR